MEDLGSEFEEMEARICSHTPGERNHPEMLLYHEMCGMLNIEAFATPYLDNYESSSREPPPDYGVTQGEVDGIKRRAWIACDEGNLDDFEEARKDLVEAWKTILRSIEKRHDYLGKRAQDCKMDSSAKRLKRQARM